MNQTQIHSLNGYYDIAWIIGLDFTMRYKSVYSGNQGLVC